MVSVAGIVSSVQLVLAGFVIFARYKREIDVKFYRQIPNQACPTNLMESVGT